MTKYFFGFIGLIFIPISCTKDKESPAITITSPPIGAEMHWGDIFHAEATFSDDKKLASYHVHIGDSAGNHIESWDYEDAENVTKGIFTWNDHIAVPDSVPDSVWLYFEVIDEVGKITEDEIKIYIAD